MCFGIGDPQGIVMMTVFYGLSCVFINSMSYLYSFQLSIGCLKYHWCGSVIYFSVLVSSLLWAFSAIQVTFIPAIYAAVGFVYLLFWGGVIHTKFNVAHLQYAVRYLFAPVVILSFLVWFNKLLSVFEVELWVNIALGLFFVFFYSLACLFLWRRFFLVRWIH